MEAAVLPSCREEARAKSSKTMPRRLSGSNSISIVRSDGSPNSRSHPRDCRCSACKLRGDSPASRSDGERLSPALTRALAREQIGLESCSATPSPTNRSLSPAISCTSHSSIGDDFSHSSSPDHRSSPQTRGRRLVSLSANTNNISFTPASTCSALSSCSTSRISNTSSIFPPISSAPHTPTDHDSDADLTPELPISSAGRRQLRLCKPSSHSQPSSQPLHRDSLCSVPYPPSHPTVCNTLPNLTSSMSPSSSLSHSSSLRMPHVQTLPDLPHRPVRLGAAGLRRSKTEASYSNSPVGSPLRRLQPRNGTCSSQNSSPSSRHPSTVFEGSALSLQEEESKGLPRCSSDSTNSSGNVSPPLTPTARPQRNASMPLQLPQTPYSPEVVIPTGVSSSNKGLRGISALPDFDAEIVRDLHRRSNENREHRLRRLHDSNSPSMHKLRPSVSDNAYEMPHRVRVLNPLVSPPHADDFIQSPDAMNHSLLGRPSYQSASLQCSSISSSVHPSVTASAPTPVRRATLPPPLHLPPSAIHTEQLIAKPLELLPLEPVEDIGAGGESEHSDAVSDAGSLCSQCERAEVFSRLPVSHPRPLSLTPLKQPRPTPHESSMIPFPGPSALSLCLPSASPLSHNCRPRLPSLSSAADPTSSVNVIHCLMPCPPPRASLPRSSTLALAAASQPFSVNHDNVNALRCHDLHESEQAGGACECEAGADGQAL